MPVANYLTSFAAVPASDGVETTTLNLFTNQETNANNLAESKVATRVLAAEAEDPNAVTVSTAQDFINAIQKGTATTINVASDLNLGDIRSNTNYTQNISNKRDIVIQSADGDKKTIDLNGYSFNMNSDNSVTFKNLTMYGRNWFGAVENASSYTFDNVDYTGSELVYTTRSATVTFKNNVTAHAVDKYTSPLDSKEYGTQTGQQVLQFTTGTNQIIFDEGSNVNLETDNGNVIQNQGDATITVKNGANVTLNPHASTKSFEGAGTVGQVARGIYSAGGAINIEQGGNLVINLSQNSGDPYLPGAIYLNSGAVINDNGNIKINVNGEPYSGAKYTPVYLNGDSTIKVGNGASFEIAAENLGAFNSSLFTVDGKGTVTLEPHSTFKISGDGTGALTAVGLGSGSTFSSDQPDEFTIDLSANTSSGKTLIKNGTINFTRVKNTNVASQYQVALGKVDATYSSNGTLSNSVVTSLNKDVPTTIYDYIKSNPSALSFVAAGEDVTLNSLHLDKNNQLTGIATSTGDSKTPIYITVLINDSATGVPEAGMYRLYTDTDGNITTTKVTYTGTPKNPDGSPKPNGGEFSIDLSSLASQLTDDAKITVVASKDFVESPTLTETVEALRQVNIDALQKLVDAAPEEEQKPSYYNASEEAQKAYTDAIAAGQEILDSPASYDQSDVDRAVSVIQLALTALTGKETDKTALQTAVDQASSVESSDNYTNADTSLQDDYQAAIKAGQGILSKENATQTEVDNALTTINNAKSALNGDAKKAASKEALQKAVDEAPTVKSDDAAYYNGSAEAKAAYDNAITAGQTVLDDSDATATQITAALDAINTAKGNLKGEATDKSALQKAVDNSATVKESNNYTNADETQKTAYDNAVTAAQTVLGKTNATQAEVNKALQDLETANNNLNGDAKKAASKEAL
ncbi:FIVAR domain-containing protein [Limosilactobacillus reuteri]|nr:FIVAR domain-containing protein [Limosilactobacillus reuteri]MCC4381921.1 FIVAR domain-containing protein [Limosilactobacillus reuteri]